MMDKAKINKKKANPKYTIDLNVNKHVKRWPRKGIRIYNDLVKVVSMNSLTIHIKEMEIKLKEKYATICGKNGERNGNDGSSGADNIDDESLELYNGIAGDSSIATVTLKQIQFILLIINTYFYSLPIHQHIWKIGSQKCQ